VSLSYDSGTGNGPYGMGCSPSLPVVTRKTEKGIPQYRDHEESDVFILSGVEDLVPVLKKDCDHRWRPDEFERDGYQVKRYRPRVEGLFARIERWTRLKDGDIHWRSISKENVLTVYGSTVESRISDPAAPHHTFSWLICQSYDDRGNGMIYEYAAEDERGVDLSRPNEQHRVRSANRYPKRIRYGNRRPFRFRTAGHQGCLWQPSEAELRDSDWMFEAVFDYGEGHYQEAPPDGDGRIFVHATTAVGANSEWPERLDSFSAYRAGFEIRTHRLCRRVLMFHRFPTELGVAEYLVRATEFEYEPKPFGSFMTRVTHSGFKRQADGRYLKKSMPPVDLSYTASPLEDLAYDGFEMKEVDPVSLGNLPGGIDGSGYRWLDLDGEGISGVLSEQGNAWFYKRNLGDGHFGPVELIATKPSITGLNTGRQELLDVAGDGNLDLVQLDQRAPGFFERTENAEWGRFRTFNSLPVQDWKDPNLRFMDLTGDGIPDVLIAQGETFTWHPSLLQEGFGAARRVPIPNDEERGPRIIFSDGTQSVYLADISGDGLSDIVRIRNGEICYWPNLGYGRFGAKITMDNAPRFDEDDQFDQRRIRLADTDGSGTTDILYLGREGIHIYLNESGNGWSAPRTLRRFPATDELTSISVVDFLGRGTACLLWSSPLPSQAGRPLRYVDLMAGRKPHLLTNVRNNLGAETVIDYASSTEFYLADKAAGEPWITRLPFPVHVVKRVETYDRISRNRFVTTYRYHHGRFDASEREFRGFGMIEQLDTEEFAVLNQSERFPAGENVAASSHVPPVLTKTWFHLGAFLRGKGISKQYEDEFYQEGHPRRGESTLGAAHLAAMVLPDTVLPDDIESEEISEACRALKGSILRQEIYALDGTEAEDRPYTVSERNYTIQRLQPRQSARYAVFFVHPREQIDLNYERKLFSIDEHGKTEASATSHCPPTRRPDPRVTHAFTLDVDGYGNVLLSAAVAYGRRFEDPSLELREADRQKQWQIHVTFAVNGYTNATLQADVYRGPVICEARTFELRNVQPSCCWPSVTNLFRFEELLGKIRQAGDGGHDLPYENWDVRGGKGSAPARRLIEHVRTVYRRDDYSGLLPLGQMQSLALPGQSFKLALTTGLLNQVFKRGGRNLLPDPMRVLRDEGGYRLGDDLVGEHLFPNGPSGHWWIPSDRVFFSPNATHSPVEESSFAREHFYLPHRFQDPFGNNHFVQYEAHNLLVRETRDALGNSVVGECDYRVLQSFRLTDPNRNRSEVAFDALGLVVGSAIMGKAEENKGDSLEGFCPDLTQADIDAFFAAPKARAAEYLGKATGRTIYDLDRYAATAGSSNVQPAFAATLVRETHESDLSPGEVSKVQVSVSYSDGFGREIQKKIQAEPGRVENVRGDGRTATVDTGPNIRWVASGWTVFNNKGKAVRQYEPFFSVDHRFEFGRSVGVSPILFYDPITRVVATLQPNHTYAKEVFDPWRQTSWDPNDTVTLLDPRQDIDVGQYFVRLLESEFFPTWYARRKDGSMGECEKEAALKAAAHAATPTTAYFDSLGRPFLSLAHNRLQRNRALVDERYATRTELDIEGNQRSVIDALDRTVVTYDYDLLGNRIHQSSMEAGQRWMLNDAIGKPIRTWDSRGHNFRTEYDGLRRPVRAFVVGPDSSGSNEEILYQRTIYGEHQGDAGNHRARIFQTFDTAGVLSNVAFDFKGNLLRGTRQFAADYKRAPNWAAASALEEEVFSSSTEFDALNRPISLTTPDGSITRPGYNEANLLERLAVNLRGAERATPFVTNVDYNAKGQRVSIEYGILDGEGLSKVRTDYSYDPERFRLIRLLTTRGKETQLQDLNYCYDPAGNITSIRDHAQQTIYFEGQVVEPHNAYVYDAIYRLIAAQGREHIGQVGQPTPPSWDDKWQVNLPHPNDGQAMRRYQQSYQYDPVGNFQRVIHVARNGNWTRSYDYREASQIEVGKVSNRLTATAIGETRERYQHDAHGNMTRMPHLGVSAGSEESNLKWGFDDRLRKVELPGGGDAFYVYDASGQRVRKVVERSASIRCEEQRYLTGFEILRRFAPDGATLLSEVQTLHVVDGAKRLALVEAHAIGEAQAPHPIIRFQLSNHLGSASLELGEHGEIISYEEFTPYGGTSYQALGKGAFDPKRYRFSGKERDLETGLYYHGARFYAAWLGRWVSPDPSDLRDGLNLFLYVSGNPINSVDLNGGWKISWTDVAIGAGVAILVVAAVAVTAGAAAGPIAAGLASAGLTAGEISTLGTVAVAAGTTYGVVGTARTANELVTGINSETGQPLTDEEGSRRLGALPVQVIGTALGVRGLAGGGGGGPTAPAPLRLTTPEGFSFGTVSASAPEVSVAGAIGTGAGVGAGTVPLLMSMMNGGSSGGGSGDDGSRSDQTPGPSRSADDIAGKIRDLPEEQQDRLLSRVVRGDAKGRPFGTPRNPRLPTVEEFNPRVREVKAGELDRIITGTKHGINPEQAASVRTLSNEELVRFRIEDPISGTGGESDLSVTGGHHRLAEIINRVNVGELSPDTLVQILFHD
jgi:RHS repeat-associated protein